MVKYAATVAPLSEISQHIISQHRNIGNVCATTTGNVWKALIQHPLGTLGCKWKNNKNDLKRIGAIQMELLKVSSQSKPKLVAGAIAAVLRTGESVEIQAIGAAAVNQAVKSIAVARGYVAPNGIDLVSYPAFSQLEVDGAEKTSIKFVIENRSENPIQLSE